MSDTVAFDESIRSSVILMRAAIREAYRAEVSLDDIMKVLDTHGVTLAVEQILSEAALSDKE